MRMRKRPNLEPRMERCAELIIKDPENCRGRWTQIFPGYSEMRLELGCGKGRFTADTAETRPDVMLIALEKIPDAMIIAMERVKERKIENVRFIDGDAAKLLEMFSPEDRLSRIYINFCDPWPKSRDAKFRLTSPSFLRLYADTLPTGGQIHFKTDNTALFDWSVTQFQAEGWELSELSHDLHANGTQGVMTDYEAKFCAEGMKINRLVATKCHLTLGTAAGPVPRLRNAALSDARGYTGSGINNDKETDG